MWRSFASVGWKGTYKEPPRGAAVVMLDGGRVQTRAEDAGRGVSEPGWRESKVACCLTIADEGPGRGSSARAAREVLGADECGAIGVRSEASQPAGDRAERCGSPGEPSGEGKGRERSPRSENGRENARGSARS